MSVNTVVVLATGNSGKLTELKSYFSGFSIQFKSQKDLLVNEVAETGTTFIENAIIKARHAAKQTGLPALADDSGLMVDALNGAPGIYSARYAGIHATAEQRIEKLLTELTGMDRRASFCCALAFLQNAEDPAPIIAFGRWHGSILEKPVGSDGFGYDPIFWVPTHHCSAAQLCVEEKNKISHRGIAMQQFVAQMKPLFSMNPSVVVGS